jgi:transcriptional regulator with XRE-family HTH domain
MTSVATQTDECGDAAHRLYAAELRRWRQERGVTQERLAALTHYSAALVGMVEKLQRNPTREFTSRCDDVLATGGALARLLPLLAAESYPSWFRPFVEMEAEATAIQEFEVQVIAGLLQTEDYARAVLNSWPPKSAEEIERRLAARLDRQRILDRTDPPLLSFVLDESVLRRPMGPRNDDGRPAHPPDRDRRPPQHPTPDPHLQPGAECAERWLVHHPGTADARPMHLRRGARQWPTVHRHQLGG